MTGGQRLRRRVRNEVHLDKRRLGDMKQAQNQSNVPAPTSRAQYKITCLERVVADLDFPEPLDLNCLGLHVGARPDAHTRHVRMSKITSRRERADTDASARRPSKSWSAMTVRSARWHAERARAAAQRARARRAEQAGGFKSRDPHFQIKGIWSSNLTQGRRPR